MATDSKEAEAKARRSQHPDFKKLSPDSGWTFGAGANHTQANTSASAATAKHIFVDPYAPDRTLISNYKLLVGAIVPRPIAFISTRARDGTSENLAPMSFFQLINVDPPLFVIGIVSPLTDAKDTLRNLLETSECVINIISEGFVEAANATSIDTPYGVSEWDVSGLTPMYDCQTVSCARVKESVFSIEAKLESVREFNSRINLGSKSGSMVIVEATRFWAREDAINEDKTNLDLAVLRPVSRLGGVMYGRMTEVFELLRPGFENDLKGMEGVKKLKEQREVDGTVRTA
ncbi:hypothetical protein B7463_g7828, partial [Scytalidium lignicola]